MDNGFRHTLDGQQAHGVVKPQFFGRMCEASLRRRRIHNPRHGHGHCFYLRLRLASPQVEELSLFGLDRLVLGFSYAAKRRTSIRMPCEMNIDAISDPGNLSVSWCTCRHSTFCKGRLRRKQCAWKDLSAAQQAQFWDAWQVELERQPKLPQGQFATKLLSSVHAQHAKPHTWASLLRTIPVQGPLDGCFSRPRMSP